jgi:hypothetical protein
MTRRRAGVCTITALALTAIPAVMPRVAGQSTNSFNWVRDFLSEFSLVTDSAASGPREIVSTRLESHPEPGRAILMYQRATYSGSDANTLQSQQVIQYTLRLTDIVRDSVRVETWSGTHSGTALWLVRAAIDDDAGFVPYTNVVEQRLADGSVDVTSSRGRVREIVLGYFSDESTAARLADGFTRLLETGVEA